MTKPFGTSFDDCRKIEARGWEDLKLFLKQYARNGQFVVTDKGDLSKFLQETIGDGLFNDYRDEKCWAFELKTEDENRHGNFFLEYWSNLSRFNPGWLFKLNTDLLFYQFLKERHLYCMSFPKLRHWAFRQTNRFGWPGRIFEFELKKQKRHIQLNDTWGFCVPITIIQAEVGFRLINLKDDIPVILNNHQSSTMEQKELF